MSIGPGIVQQKKIKDEEKAWFKDKEEEVYEGGDGLTKKDGCKDEDGKIKR